MTILNNGNVGIGTSTPSSTLAVQGTMDVTTPVTLYTYETMSSTDKASGITISGGGAVITNGGSW